MRSALILASALFASQAAADAPTNRGPFHKIAIVHLKEASGEAIDPSVKASLLRRLASAEEWGADCIILEIESYGGMVSSSLESGDEVYDIGRRIHTIAYVPRRAISGGAMLAVSCREIIMNEVALIGDSQAVYFTSEGMQRAPEKGQTMVAATFRKYAEGNGYPIPICEAMVRQEMEVVRYKKAVRNSDGSRGFTWVYFRADTDSGEPDMLEREEQGLSGREVVVLAEELATFSAREAMEYSLCARLEPDLESLLESLEAPGAEVRHMEWNWAERTSRWLLGMRVLLFLVGAGALYFALKMPGTGVPEALAIICFGLFFGASAIAGLAGALEVILFFIGIALIVVEIFVLPGFGIAGLAGLVFLLVSIGLAAIPEGKYDEAPTYYLIPIARDFFIALFGATIIAFTLARFLPKVPFLRGLALESGPQPGSLTGSAMSFKDSAVPDALVGSIGVAESALRPAGRALIEGKHRDVVAENDFIEAGLKIRVVTVRGNVITVRATGDQG